VPDTVRSILCLLLVVGCAGAESVDVAPPDAGAPEVDASVTAESPRGCEVQLKEPTGITRGRAGGTGGGKGPILACDDTVNERIVGVAVRMSNQATTFGGRSAHGIGIACARVTVDAAGTAEVGQVKTMEVSGLGTYSWAPSTWGAITQCKPGWIVSGMRVHTGTGANRLLDISIICSKLGTDAAPGTTETIKVAGSLTDANGLDEAKCAAGEVLAQLGTWTGAGIDAVDLSCSRPTCR
jgi:hypothetical protein